MNPYFLNRTSKTVYNNISIFQIGDPGECRRATMKINYGRPSICMTALFIPTPARKCLYWAACPHRRLWILWLLGVSIIDRNILIWPYLLCIYFFFHCEFDSHLRKLILISSLWYIWCRGPSTALISATQPAIFWKLNVAWATAGLDWGPYKVKYKSNVNLSYMAIGQFFTILVIFQAW